MNDKKKEEIKGALEVLDIVKKWESGDFLGAIKHALTSKRARKAAMKMSIKMILTMIQPYLFPIIMGLISVVILSTMVGKFISFIEKPTASVNGFLDRLAKKWEEFVDYVTDDYWIKLDEKFEYVVDGETGVTLGTPDDGNDYSVDEEGKPRKTLIEEDTVVDKYLKELGNQGFSIKALRLLGDTDYTYEELMKNEKDKNLVEKYIAEFIRADIITQQPHKRRGTELVKPDKQDWVDGGIYVYRNKKENNLDDADTENNGVEVRHDINISEEYKRMTFLDKAKYLEKLGCDTKTEIADILDREFEVSDKKTFNELKFSFTMDLEKGTMIFVETTSEISSSSESYSVKPVAIDYKQYTSKYAMPYEFLINLCEITQNPEFVYHIALLARDTKIVLVVEDNTTTIKDVTTTTTTTETATNYASSSTDGASTSTSTSTSTEVVIKTNQKPVLMVHYANTWSFFDYFPFNKKTVNVTSSESPESVTNNGGIDGPLDMQVGSDGVPYWESSKDVSVSQKSSSLTVVTTYEPAKEGEDECIKNIEKSKQFLGLLRNKDGECEYECYQIDMNILKKQDPEALKCAREAEFVESGINVQYKIPNLTKTEAPINRLTSGIELLYAVMQDNTKGYKEEDLLLDNISDSANEQQQYIAAEDYHSVYVVKMQGLVEHMRYLMTFPEPEDLIYELELEEIEKAIEDGQGSGTIDMNDGEVTGQGGKFDAITDEERQILYAVCHAEARGSSPSEIGHIASVILNRVKSSDFPNTVEGVVTQPGQFSGNNNTNYQKWMNNKVSEAERQAVIEGVDNVLANGDTTGGAIFFWTKAVDEKQKKSIKGLIFLFQDPNTHVFYTTQKALDELSATTGSLTGSSSITEAAESVHKYLRSNGYTYDNSIGKKINNSSQKLTDCSHFVTWTLYEAGYRGSGFKEGMSQWNSGTFNNNPHGWQVISNISQAQAGDILCYSGHVEIYAGSMNGSKPVVWNCGGNSSIKAAETSTSSHTTNKITKILRVPI